MKPDFSVAPVREDVEVHKRKYLTPKQKAAILLAQPDCDLCHSPFVPGDEIQFDHRIARALGGTNDPSNFKAVHKACHAEKTAKDAPAVAKAKRLEAKRKGQVKSGGRKISSRPFQKRNRRR